MTRTHAPHPDPSLAAEPARMTLCGRGIYQAGEVDCIACGKLRARAGVEVKVALREVFAVVGARELSDTGRRAIAQARLERDAPKRIWTSVDKAVRAWVRMRDEGAALRSTCDPDRANRVQTSRDPSLGGREHDAIERTATVGKALDAAERYPLALIDACPYLEPSQARSVYLMSVAGRAFWHRSKVGNTELKGGCHMRVSLSVIDVADRATTHYRQPVGWRHVVALRSHFGGVVMDALIASGEMRAARGRVPRRGSFAAGMAR